MGVPYVWLLDPGRRRAHAATKTTGLCEVKGEVLRTENPALEVAIREIFES